MTLEEAAQVLIEKEQNQAGYFELSEDEIIALMECLDSHAANIGVTNE